MECGDKIGGIDKIAGGFVGDMVGLVLVVLPLHSIDESSVFKSFVNLRIDDFGNFVLQRTVDFDRGQGIDGSGGEGILVMGFEEGDVENIVNSSE